MRTFYIVAGLAALLLLGIVVSKMSGAREGVVDECTANGVKLKGCCLQGKCITAASTPALDKEIEVLPPSGTAEGLFVWRGLR